MNFFYRNWFGRILCGLFIKRKWFSKLYGAKQRTTGSKKKIEPFIEKYNINVDEIENNVSTFPTFNDFFIRKLKEGARMIDRHPSHLMSPSDSRVLVYNITKDLAIPVKGRNVSLRKLLSNSVDFEAYQNGACAIFRLAPTDYHRFCYFDDGTQTPVIAIRGNFHSVSPFAIDSKAPVFDGNYREVCTLQSDHFGDVIHIDVGALVVGRIIQHNPNGAKIKKGEEKGYFEFGASTVILLFKQGVVNFDQDIVDASKQNIESLVKMGEKIGTKQ
jgi:phosphatidylserine decarboxylase